MTQYAKDFSDEGTTGIFATDFTSRFASTADWTIENPGLGEEDDRTFQSDGSGADTQLVSWDDIDGDANRDECEMVARFKQDEDDGNQFRIYGRASGSGGAEEGYALSINSSGQLDFFRWDTGSLVAIGNEGNTDSIVSHWRQFTGDVEPSFTDVPADLWLWLRFRINGTGATVSLSGKLWVDGISGVNEPSIWTIEHDDTSGDRHTAAGWIGFGRGVHLNDQVDVDYFGVGTDGDAAPINASTNTVVRVTAAYAEVALSETNPELRITTLNAEVFGRMTDPEIAVTQHLVQVVHDGANPVGGGSDQSGALTIIT
jgi:hypothetical protein